MLDKYENFEKRVNEAAGFFKEFDKNKAIRVISHIDCDGICAASILIKALNNNNIKYSLSTVQQLNKKMLDELKNEKYSYYIFTDLGSGIISSISEQLSGRKIIILDHHEFETDKNFENIAHVNPHLFGIDGSKEISGAGVVYLFSSTIDKDCINLAHIALIGAIGDIQENNGFLNLNDKILKKAVSLGLIRVERGFRFFGLQTRPVHKILEYSSDPFIPGVSGSESAAIQFLNELGIDPKKGNDWKTIQDLSEDEMKKLAAGIIMKRHSEEDPEDIFGNVYVLEKEKEPILRDIKEFSTLLNACGRLGKASLGIGTCLGIESLKKKAIDNLSKYKRELVKALNWYRDNQESENIISKNGYIIINAENNVMGTMIGVLASIISKSNHFDHLTYILAIAHNDDSTSKISLRVSGDIKKLKGIDLRTIVTNIVNTVGGEAGGHMNAAGAVIKTENENVFIEEAQEMFEKLLLEESVD
ncbi:MAG: DHH family phosphoesterase [Candidatus Woesearchaeota archaeon]